MLHINGLTKVYLPKNGVSVRALDSVDLKFEETGMVFVLGKSGSGKSTLLNLIGGLDSVTAGTITIKGKSSENFTQSDFDSYRNTFIGFIFQEYNILNEFSVGKNLAIALELQGKKATPEKVDEILEQVDLKGYGNRRPNELSGGQKQRVAIARALIKDPEIIMADEPTGALDSNISKQVFETLQKLSKTKLVIIVSHDRDYAEYYGDRVIEFADGKVLSDIRKYKTGSETVSDGISIIDNKVLHVKKGHKFSKAEKDKVIEFLENSNQSDIILSRDEKSNTDFRRLARIDNEGNKESFEAVTTKNQNIKQYDASQLKLTRSRLPIKHSLKIAASSMKAKPVRLVLTIFLSLIAFALFGLADTIGAYNRYNAMHNSMAATGINTMSFGFARGTVSERGNSWWSYEMMSDEDAETLRQAFPNHQFDVLRYPGMWRDSWGGPRALEYGRNVFDYTHNPQNVGMFYTRQGQWGGGNLSFGGVIEFPSNFSGNSFRGKNIIGRLPETNYEAVVSRYIFETFYALGYLRYAQWRAAGAPHSLTAMREFRTDINTEQDLFNISYAHPLLIGDGHNHESLIPLNIVGIIDTQFPSLYDSLREPPQGGTGGGFDIIADVRRQEIQTEFSYGFHGAIFVKHGVFEEVFESVIQNKYTAIGQGEGNWLSFDTHQGGQGWIDVGFLAPSSRIGQDGLTAFFGDGRADNQLRQGEMLLSLNQAMSFFNAHDWMQSFGEEWEWINGQSVQRPPEIVAYERQQIIDILLEFYNETAFIDWYTGSMIGGWYWCSYTQMEIWIASRAMAIEFMEINSREYEDVYDSCDCCQLYTWWVGTKPVDGTGSAERWLSLRYGGDSLEAVYIFLARQGNHFDFGLTWQEARMRLFDAQAFAEHFIGEHGFYIRGHASTRNTSRSFSITIVGVAMDNEEVVQDQWSSFNFRGVVLYDAFYNFFSSGRANIAAMITNLADTRAAQIDMIRFSYEFNMTGEVDEWGGESFSMFAMRNAVSPTLNTMHRFLQPFGVIFLWVGVGFALFAALLLLNFIMVSISYKKREIGILRALGARSADVFGIFFLESLLITLISFLLAVVTAGVGAFVLNLVLRQQFGFVITLLSFGIRQIALVLAVSVVVAFIASFLPVFRTARKKPIEAIRTA